MKKLCLYLFAILAISSGCDKPPSAAELRAESIDRAQVTTLAIKASIPPDTSFKHQLKSRIESAEWHSKFEKRSGRIRTQSAIDTLKHLSDTSDIYLTVADSLNYVEPDYLEKVLSGNDSNSPYKEVENWAPEIKVVYKDKIFNIHDCLPIHGYKVFSENRLPKGINPRFFAGTIKLSQVFFNKKRTRAFITTYFYCGNLCAAEYDIFFEKRKEKWVLVRRVMGVVS